MSADICKHLCKKVTECAGLLLTDRLTVILFLIKPAATATSVARESCSAGVFRKLEAYSATLCLRAESALFLRAESALYPWAESALYPRAESALYLRAESALYPRAESALYPWVERGGLAWVAPKPDLKWLAKWQEFMQSIEPQWKNCQYSCSAIINHEVLSSEILHLRGPLWIILKCSFWSFF